MSVVLAADTTRSIGLVIAVVIFLGALAAIFFNIKASKAEVGSEIELAANRKPYLPDEELEGKKLDIALTLGLVLLTICSLTLPAYWLAEPGRQENATTGKVSKFEGEGEELYAELCSNCHGSIDQGGVAAFTLQTDTGRFIQSVDWVAPALNTAGWRYSEEDLTHILNYGRTASPMPAWGAPGGGPQTAQQIEALIAYINSEEVKPTITEMRAEVDEALELEMDALIDENGDYVAVVDGDIRYNRNASCAARVENDNEDASAEALADLLAEECDVPIAMSEEGEPLAFYASEGEALYNLGIESGFASGSYSCARCHTPGASYGANEQLQHFPIPGSVDPDSAEIKAIVKESALGPCVLVAQGASESDMVDLTPFNGVDDPEPVEDLPCQPLAGADEDDDSLFKRLEGEVIGEAVAGSGALGPSLVGIEERCTRAQHIAFINVGSQTGVKYCNQRQGSNGVMPAFAEMLSAEHIEAIVDYERGLTQDEAVNEEAEVQAG